MPGRWPRRATGRRRSTPSTAFSTKAIWCCRRARATPSAPESRRCARSEERQSLTPMLRDAILAWLDVAASAVEQCGRSMRSTSPRWPRNSPRAIAMREAHVPDDWTAATRRGIAHAAPARRRPALSDGIGRAALAAFCPHVDRRSRAHPRPARPVPRHRGAASGSPSRIRCWRIGARGLRRPAPNVRRISRSAQPASASGCSPKGRRRSGSGSRRCGSAGGKASEDPRVPRAHPQINLLHMRIALQRGGRPLQGDAPGLQYISVIGDAERQRDRLLGEKQREPLAV